MDDLLQSEFLSSVIRRAVGSVWCDWVLEEAVFFREDS